MRNSTQQTVRKGRFSTYLAHRNRLAAGNLQFVKDHQGSISASKLNTGAYRVVFSSAATGRKAFAYGQTFLGAYQNMIRLYNIKYARS